MVAFQPASTATRARRKLGRIARSLVARGTSWIAPGRGVELYIDRPLNICLPFRNREQLAAQIAGIPQLQRLGAAFGTAGFVFVTLQTNSLDNSSVDDIARIGGSLSTVPDFRSLVSFLAGAQFMVVLPEESPANGGPSTDGESLKEWCDAFHVGYFTAMAELVDFLQLRGPLKISGPYCSTYAVHKSLWLSVLGNQYAFTEALDWAIVKRLPGKFAELSASSEVNAHPFNMLSGPLNRITRQRAVGKLYQEYLQGDSVLDIGCDVRGVSDFVGPKTRYLGIDMHGKPDILLNLDRDKLPFEPASIDTIVCVETLEHLQRIHAVLDDVMTVSRKYVICSLPVEAAFTRNRLVDPLGGTYSFGTPLAPVFDRHQWLGNIVDSLDLVYYRSARSGFTIRRLDLFYLPKRGAVDQRARVLTSFRQGRISDLNRRVGMIMFVLERTR
jgi:hypothetical protein